MSTVLTIRQVWGAPLLLGIVTTFGLISALIGDGVWDVLSWFALGAPVAVIIWYVAKPKLKDRSRRRMSAVQSGQ